MKTFLIKSAIVIIAAALIFTVKLLYNIYEPPFQFNFNLIPLNNLANSTSFRAKADHLIKSDNFRESSILIAGSSIALNNVSGMVLEEKTKHVIYNISSWGLAAENLLDMLKALKQKKSDYILIAFSNCDFGPKSISTDEFELFLTGSKLTRYYLLISQMRLSTFFDDIEYRKNYGSISNTRKSLNFDETGSVLYEPQGYIPDNLWNKYIDTTGFKNNFLYHIARIQQHCQDKGITLYIAYMPLRSDLLNASAKSNNDAIAGTLKANFGNSFIDLHNLELPDKMFLDGYHMFKDGAIEVTGCVVDTLKARGVFTDK